MIVRPDDPKGIALLALTVRQPWASQIAAGSKLAEYRTWSTDYRGDLLITAGSYPAKGGPLGCAICVVDVYDMVDRDEDFAWLLRNPRAVPQLAVKGRLGLWEVSADLAKALGLNVVLAGTGR